MNSPPNTMLEKVNRQVNQAKTQNLREPHTNNKSPSIAVGKAKTKTHISFGEFKSKQSQISGAWPQFTD